ncbi:MAG: DNA-binding response regulator [Chloroflexi bacterium RBG_16_57_8]|nr:MAG: DNA-binding response regulator [Chloroflexi bacterium RBG_16_57_8]
MNSGQIRVMLVDDHAVVRSGLGAVLASFEDLKLVGEANNGQEAVRLCEQLKPDVILMDLLMPVMDGVTATKAIHDKWPDIRIIALTSFGDRELIEGALKAGAMSYLIKTVSATELATAIRGAVSGKPSLSPEAAQVLMQSVKEPGPAYDLTEREHEILSLMVTGLSNNDIAERLIVSRSTVKFHVSNILSKLGVSTRTEAVALALRNKLVK